MEKFNDELAEELKTSKLSLKLINKKAVSLDKTVQAKISELAYYQNALNESAIIAITDSKGIITHVNDKFCQISQYSEAELIGHDHKIVNSGYHSRQFMSQLWATIAKGEIWKGDIKNKAKDGSYYWVQTNIIPFLNEKGKPYQYFAIRNDITSRKLAEEQLEAMTRLYKFVSHVNQTIVFTQKKDELFDKVCSIAIQHGNYKMATIGLFDHTGKHIDLMASRGANEQDLRLMKRVHDQANNITKKLIDGGEYLVFNDLEHDGINLDWQKYLVGRGFLSTYLLPIKAFGKVIGLIYLCSDQKGIFQHQEMVLLDEVIGDVSFAMELFEKEAARKKIEQQLNRSDKILNQAQRIAKIGSWEVDLDTNTITWSDEMYRILDVPIGSINPDTNTYFDFVHPDDLEAARHDLSALIVEKKDTANHYRLVLKNGLTKHVYSDARYELDSAGNPIRIYGILHDVTEQVEVEMKLIKNEKFLSSIIANSSDGIVLRDTNLKATYVSPNCTVLLGYSENQLKEINWDAWLYPDEVPYLKKTYEEVIADTSKLHVVEFRFKKPDGKSIWLEASYSNYLNDPDINAIIINYRDVTNRKKAQDALKQSEANLYLIMDSLPVIIMAKDKQGKLIFANNSFCQLYGKAREQLLNEDFVQHIPSKEDAKLIKAEDNKVLQTGRPSELRSHTVTDATGKGHVFQTIKLPFYPIGSKEMAILTVSTDITETQIANEKLQASEKLYRGIFESQTNYLVRTDLNGKYSFYNDKFLNDFGWVYGGEEIIGKDTLQSVMPYHHHRMFETVQKCFESPGKIFKVELDKPGKDDTIITSIWDFVLISDSDGNPKEMQCVGINITDWKVAESSLLESSYLLEKAQQIAHMGHWVSSLGRNVHYRWSDEMFTICGLDRLTTTASHELFLKTIYPADKAKFVEACQTTAGTGKRCDIEHRIIHADKSIRWFRHQLDVVVDNDKESTSLIGVCQDITERKLAEENIIASEAALRRLNNELEQRVAARTASLLDVNQELEAFSYTVSHDLRTPIRAVQIFAHLLKDKYDASLDNDAKIYLTNILTCADEMTALINDLLEISKLGRTDLASEEVDMNLIVKTIANNLLRLEPDYSVQIRVAELEAAVADATLIKSVWLNLLSNALKYRAMDGVCEVKVYCQRQADSIVYTVEDNGIGFDMKYYDKLFKPFSRLTSSPEYKGTGAGLAICERIIKKHGGTIWAESLPNVGSKFHFALPTNKKT